MEPIKQAVERAKLSNPPTAATANVFPPAGRFAAPPVAPQAVVQDLPNAAWLKEVELNPGQLEKSRIVAHNVTDPRCRPYDVLRTQVLQAMDKRGWQFLAITSPTEGCGKTLTSVNLALSIARQEERSVVLVDLDLQRPKVATYLGLKTEHGVVSKLSGRTTLADSMLNAQVGGYQCALLPAETRSIHSSELIASRAMRTTLQEIKAAFPSSIVLLDLPPVFSGDDVLSILPFVDCFLLVAAVGSTTVSDVRECNRYLNSAEVIRIVLNKSSEQRTYYGY